jgi:hypothetical protein
MTISTPEAARAVARAFEQFAQCLERDAGDPPHAPAPAPAPRPAPARPPPAGDGAVVPFGRDKGTLISEATDATLKWLGEALETSLNDPSKAPYAGKNRRELGAVRDEQNRRFVR